MFRFPITNEARWQQSFFDTVFTSTVTDFNLICPARPSIRFDFSSMTDTGGHYLFLFGTVTAVESQAGCKIICLEYSSFQHAPPDSDPPIHSLISSYQTCDEGGMLGSRFAEHGLKYFDFP